MRKLVLLLVLALAIPAAASARGGDKGDGTYAVKNAVGQITVNAKGTALGRVDKGEVTVVDLSGTTDIQVLGYDRKPRVKDGAVVYRGEGMRFRIVGGWYSLVVTGSGINLSAVGTGTVTGKGISEGLFSTDGSPFRPAPAVLYAGVFGQQ